MFLLKKKILSGQEHLIIIRTEIIIKNIVTSFELKNMT